MRKLTASILLFVYLTTVAGGTLHQHYCMGKLVAVDVWQKQAGQKNTCPQCGMTKKKGCCEDDDRLVKNERQPDLLQSPVSVPQMECIAVKNHYKNYNADAVSTCCYILYHNNSPPGLAGAPLYIINCAYLI